MDITKDQPALNEWSVLFNPHHVKDAGSQLNINADGDELKNLARRFDLVRITFLKAAVTLRTLQGGRIIHVQGSLDAEIVQECVVSTDEVTTQLSEEFEGWFADSDQVASLHKARRDKAIQDGNELPILEEEDDPEPFVNGQIDIGELVAQSLSLAIPTYPRTQGAAFDDIDETSKDGEPAFDNPFAKLKDWKAGKASDS